MTLIANFMNVNYTFLNMTAFTAFKDSFIHEINKQAMYEGIEQFDDSLPSYSYLYKQVLLNAFLQTPMIDNVRKNHDTPVFPQISVPATTKGSTFIRKNLIDDPYTDMNRWIDDGGAINRDIKYNVV